VTARRRRLCASVVAAAFLLTGCTTYADEEEAELRAAAEKAREHRAVVGVAVALAGMLVLRHLMLLLARWRERRRVARARTYRRPVPRPGPLLVAAAASHELLATTALWAAGYLLAWTSAPMPRGDALDQFADSITMAFAGVAAVLGLVVGVTAQLVAARLPYARRAAFAFLATVHTLVAAVVLLVYSRAPDVMGIYLVVLPFAVLAAAGFWRETRRLRRRWR
jgi:hypothetical protein